MFVVVFVDDVDGVLDFGCASVFVVAVMVKVNGLNVCTFQRCYKYDCVLNSNKHESNI